MQDLIIENERVSEKRGRTTACQSEYQSSLIPTVRFRLSESELVSDREVSASDNQL